MAEKFKDCCKVAHPVANNTTTTFVYNRPMVRRDVMSELTPWGEGWPIARCTSPAGASPAPVSIGAPDSRPQS